MESKSNPKFSISNWSIKHIYRKLNLIYDIDFVIQHTKAEGGSELQFHMQTGKLHIRSDKQTAFPQAPLYWDEMGWGVGGNSRTRQQVSSFVSGLSKRISAFLRLEAFFAGMLSSKNYNFNKYMYTLHKLFRKCHTFKQITVSFLLAAFVREDYTKDIFPMVSGTDRPENSWCGRKKIRVFQIRNSQLVQRLVSRNRNIRTSKVSLFNF